MVVQSTKEICQEPVVLFHKNISVLLRKLHSVRYDFTLKFNMAAKCTLQYRYNDIHTASAVLHVVHSTYSILLYTTIIL